MYHHLILKLSLIFLITAIAAPAQASRIALIIGNAKYQNAPLDNPTNDADDMKKIMSQLGFEVILAKNANRKTMITAIQHFGTQLHHADVGLFFYAGHGLQLKGRNYLVPVDANIKSEADIEHETVDAARVLAQMERANNGINIVILDACRNNPYARSFRSLKRGLTRMDGPTGTFIAYATAPGDVAADGKGRNSPFTKNLLWALETVPHLEIEQLFKKAAQKMIEKQKTDKSQVPWRHSSLIYDFCFAACPGVDVSQQLRQCEKHYQANRLTTGKGGTAFVCYNDVLTKDPNNVEAKAGLKEIEDRYVAWINRALNRGERYKAKRYFPRLCKVNPKSPNLTEIKAQLGTSCPKLIRTPVVSRSVDTGKGTFHDLLKDGTPGPKMFWLSADESIERFAIARYEVTFAEYDQFAEATGRDKPSDEDWGRGNRPVINVSWENATAYAEWLSDSTGQKYSLPTEAQWQYAAGTTSQEDICRYANVRDCSDDYDYTAPVGHFEPNKFGLFDLSGNVSEWTCSDESNSKACVGEKPSNPVNQVIILGDSWYRRQNRMAYPYELGDDYIGFRVVRY